MLLKEMFEFSPKSKRNASFGQKTGRFPFFTSSNIVERFVNAPDYSGEYLIIGDGGTGNCKYYKGEFSVSDHNYLLRPKKGTNALCVKYFLMKDGYKVLNDGFKGVGIKNVSKKYIESIDYAYNKNFSENEIVTSLQRVESLIDEKNKQITALDSLAKSRFMEMFGDVLRNTKGFQMCHFGEYVYQMNIGPFGSDLKNDCFVSKEQSACMVYEQKHAIDKTLNVPTRYIDNEKYAHLKRFEIGPGDIIVSCRGTIGECWLLPDEAPKGIIHPSLMLIKPNDAVNHEFLVYLLERILSEQTQQGSGVKMAIKAKDLSKIVCIKPEREEQDYFIDFVHLVDKSRFVVQKEIKDLQELLDSKMDEYFGGEE